MWIQPHIYNNYIQVFNRHLVVLLNHQYLHWHDHIVIYILGEGVQGMK